MGGCALITGASRGFGKALAMELARRNYDLILVSLPGEGLPELCLEFKTMGIRSDYYETDLTQKENILEMTNWVNRHFHLTLLINNVGAGGTREFTSSCVDYFDNLLQLNIRTTVLITHQLLPNLRRQPRAHILNVSSIAAFSPMGYKTVYAASKQFVQYFSAGLCQELKKTGIRVSVVHPGPMMTNDDIVRRILRQGILGKIGLMPPEAVARHTIRKMLSGRRHIIVGWLNRVSWLALKLTPSRIGTPILTRAFRREIYNQPVQPQDKIAV